MENFRALAPAPGKTWLRSTLAPGPCLKEKESESLKSAFYEVENEYYNLPNICLIYTKQEKNCFHKLLSSSCPLS